MKLIIIIIIIIIITIFITIVLSSCNTTQYVMEDDIYFKSNDATSPILVDSDTINTENVKNESVLTSEISGINAMDVSGKEKINISLGVGLPEAINLGILYRFNQIETGIGIGFFPSVIL